MNSVDTMVTELGLERRCDACGDFWPLDEEFFFHQARGFRGFAARCKACHVEKYKLNTPFGRRKTAA